MDKVKVIFRKDRDGNIIAFIPINTLLPITTGLTLPIIFPVTPATTDNE